MMSVYKYICSFYFFLKGQPSVYLSFYIWHFFYILISKENFHESTILVKSGKVKRTQHVLNLACQDRLSLSKLYRSFKFSFVVSQGFNLFKKIYRNHDLVYTSTLFWSGILSSVKLILCKCISTTYLLMLGFSSIVTWIIVHYCVNAGELLLFYTS